MHRFKFAPILGVALLLNTSVCTAQLPQARQGFWLSVSPGYGWTSVSCNSGATLSGCDRSGEHGITGMILVGGTVSPHVLVGIEASSIRVGSHDPALFLPDDGVLLGSPDVTFTTLTGIAVYYPVVTSGCFVRGGAGVAAVEINSGADFAKRAGAGCSALGTISGLPAEFR